MPSFTGKTFSNFYKNLLSTDQPSNTGIDVDAARVQDGAGNNSAILLSDDQLIVQPVNGDGNGAFRVRDTNGYTVLSVDTANSLVTSGASTTNVLTLYKEMGLYDFSPSILGYHYPLIANNMFYVSGSETFNADNDFGNGDDPATTLDVSGLSEPLNAIAIYWLLDDNITLDSVRYMTRCDNSSADTLNFHLLSYAMDTSTNHGDLSDGTVHASGQEAAAINTTIRTGTLSLDSEDIDIGRVVIGFVESTSTADVSVSFSIKYHIR